MDPKQVEGILKKTAAGMSKASSLSTSSTEAGETSLVAPPERRVGGVGRPDCPHCHGLGYLRENVPLGHPQFGKLLPCTCRVPQLEAEHSAYLRQFSNLEALAGKAFDNFVPEGHASNAEQRNSLRRAVELALAFAENPHGWLLLHGPYGCGKTHLAAAIANHRLALGQPVLFVVVPDLLDHLRSTFSPSSDIDYDDLFERVREAPLLILDDLGAESPTPWAQEKLYQIFNSRYNNRLPTVITSNVDLDRIDPRIRSRLADFDLVRKAPVNAPDFRGAPDLAQSDLSSLRLHTDKAFETWDVRKDLPAGDRDNLQKAFDMARAYAGSPAGWLVFTGPYGCGKTHLAAAIANELERRGEAALFVVVPDLLDHLRAAFNPSSLVPLDKRFEQVKTASLLVLDDLGTESATAWAREKLYQLVNYRYSALLPTVITTASPIEELDPRLATRILDPGRCKRFAILAPAYRGGKPAARRPARRR